ncbi:hypothetical protein GALMADRAFT_144636 [Galerina marginata CBS 339.88]|uniref:Uncharacterized protein n=1 Tax=Galerina marginata (strain CBS 339.88) TaxID=685588 RepID=A0A067SU70_GALM3|nr:hypothetical protein GALMADRAFT_144636 [Galerina marginata CBS 339.88]
MDALWSGETTTVEPADEDEDEDDDDSRTAVNVFGREHDPQKLMWNRFNLIPVRLCLLLTSQPSGFNRLPPYDRVNTGNSAILILAFWEATAAFVTGLLCGYE